MFRRTDPQLSLLSATSGLSEGASERLKASWAETFRREVMPELLGCEDGFSVLYAGGGRPNWSVARLLGVCLLQQVQNLNDQQALDALSFDRRWQHALDVTDDDAYLSRRSLVEFRRRLVLHDADGALLRAVFDRICAAGMTRLGVSAAEQRLDSTLVTSNIRSHGRLSLARETLRVFVRSLDERQRAQLPSELARWYALESDAWDVQQSAEQAKVAVREVGVWVRAALALFSNDDTVTASEPYQLLQRLAKEHGVELGVSQAEIAEDEGGDDDAPPSDASGESAEQRDKRQARNKRKSRVKATRARFWSPHDPDASFGHKGLGYHVHITETCRNDTTEMLTSYAVLPAAQSDIGQTMPALKRLEQSDLKPAVLYADAGYPTASEMIAMREQGVDLCAPVHRGRLAVDTLSRSDFEIEARSGEVIRCPEGHAPTRHAERESSDTIHPRRSLHAFFERDICNACPQLARCPVRQPNHARTDYRLDVAQEMVVRDARWTEQQTEPWKARYSIRGGIEATISELKRAHGLGRLRVRRLLRVTIQVALKTTACNIKRWLRAVLCGPQGAADAESATTWRFVITALVVNAELRAEQLAA
jgi:hypothetical protein